MAAVLFYHEVVMTTTMTMMMMMIVVVVVILKGESKYLYIAFCIAHMVTFTVLFLELGFSSGVHSFLLPCGSWGTKSGLQT